ncbi:peptidoglycan binding protein CsiV [Candidatus Enterovibrio escicola]|uniref:peptidoglycan binding protein CsiV n=1 Tax=Candidatus Enterovibrio escicola TaxID=1927127 RepID=UPI001237CA5F|nr:peptidoglycan binding protein CsiV [Candidatus Enterovibrio escacola]
MKKKIFLLLFTISIPSLAERWYDVEIIVFKRNQNPNTVKENWPVSPKSINFSNAISLSDAAFLATKGLHFLPKKHWKLHEAYNKLTVHTDFKPLLHMAWRQNDGSKNVMPKLRLTAGKDYGDEFHTDGTTQVGHPLDREASLQSHLRIENQNDPMSQLDGFIHVYVQHYLFVEINLILQEAGEYKMPENASIILPPMLDKQDTIIQHIVPRNKQYETLAKFQESKRSYSTEKHMHSYSFDQKRHMRSGEIHYLDHPLIGLIIQVTKVE